jgi:acyl-CoA dehydrogenase
MLPWRDEHVQLRETARRFFERECAPHRDQWEADGMAPRAIWRRAGELGLLCPRLEPDLGGSGGDFLCAVALCQEQVRAGVVAPVMMLHSDVVAPYIVHYGTPDQQARVLPRMAAGASIGAIAMTEPDAGSDLRALRTRARREGADWLVSGQKIFISNGALADVIIVAARTDNGISLFILEGEDLPGLTRSAPLDKMGQASADIVALWFDELRLPARALLGGEEGRGFQQLSDRLVEERLLTGIVAVETMDRAIAHTLAYTRERTVFGRPVLDFQNSRFRMTEARADALAARIFMERCILKFIDGKLLPTEAAMLKWWTTDLQNRIVDACLQLHGGYGYMLEFPIARMWLDSRIAPIYGGANEVMKEIIGRSL